MLAVLAVIDVNEVLGRFTQGIDFPELLGYPRVGRRGRHPALALPFKGGYALERQQKCHFVTIPAPAVTSATRGKRAHPVPAIATRYQKLTSSPRLNRIDIQIEAPRVKAPAS